MASAPQPLATDLFHPGARLGDYELEAELGRGAMGRLFAARLRGPAGFQRRVAIKVVHESLRDDRNILSMFLDEARLSAAIDHPNVVRVERLGEHEGCPYLVMELIEGSALSTLLRAQAERRAWLPVDVVVAIIEKVADGLHAAHASVDEAGCSLGLVHRDVSPQNILIDRKGRVRLIDFGVAKARHRLAETAPGATKGKLSYMSPEQLAAGEIDRRVDVFALGVVLWEALTLRRLFYSTNDLTTILKIRGPAPIERPSHFRAEIGPRLDDVVLTMLARDPEERFTTAAAARYALLTSCPSALQVDAATLACLANDGTESVVDDEPTEREIEA